MGQLNEASRKENNMKASQNFEATSSFAEPKTVEMKKQSLFKIWLIISRRTSGATDNASAYGAEDCRFESCLVQKYFCICQSY